MLAKLRPHVTYANVMSTIACFGVLAGGTAYAANTIGSADIINESIQSVDIKNGEVKNADLASSSVTSAKLYDGSVLNADLGLNSVTSDRVATNALTGADINESTLSGVKISGLTTTSAVSDATDSESPKSAYADCPAGTRPVGAGYYITGDKTGVWPNELARVVATQVWAYDSYVGVIAYEITATDATWSVKAQATCVNAE